MVLSYYLQTATNVASFRSQEALKTNGLEAN